MIDKIISKLFTVANLRRTFEAMIKYQREKANKNQKDINRLEKEVKRQTQKLDKIIDAIGDGVLNLAEAKTKVEKIREDKVLIESRLTKLREDQIPEPKNCRFSDAFLKDLQVSLISQINKEKPTQTRNFLKRYISKILVDEKQIKVLYKITKDETLKKGVSSFGPFWLPGTDSNRRQGG
jgi:hypothetical protein